jgi:capsular polysaccharide biosynthesis protein
MTAPAPSDDPGATRADENLDLDVGGYARAVARRWWLVLILVLVGAVTGIVWWYAQPAVYEATAAVYLGQPTDANGNAIVGVNSNPRAAQQIVASNDVIQEAAAGLRDGMTAKQIRRNLKVETPTITVKSTSAPTNYVAITVSGGSPEKTAAAANALAAGLVKRLSTYSDEKLAQLEAQLADQKARAGRADARLAEIERAMDRIAAGSGGSTEKQAAAAPYVPLATTLEAKVAEARQAQRDTELAILVAREVEAPRVISEAVPADEQSRSSIWLAIGAGAVAGLAIGLIVVAILTRRPSST